jgi:hypothetical protein
MAVMMLRKPRAKGYNELRCNVMIDDDVVTSSMAYGTCTRLMVQRKM